MWLEYTYFRDISDISVGEHIILITITQVFFGEHMIFIIRTELFRDHMIIMINMDNENLFFNKYDIREHMILIIAILEMFRVRTMIT